ncbi:MAG: hypothetical protein IJV67_06535 [Clostridia bacterium]|nr:hypothetical protein [Clostridia bacterium]
MICQICHKGEACKQLNKVINGNVKTFYVCKECFSSGGVSTVPPKKCRYCGRTWNEINSTLIVGCAHCYDEFASELQPIIRQVQQL